MLKHKKSKTCTYEACGRHRILFWKFLEGPSIWTFKLHICWDYIRTYAVIISWMNKIFTKYWFLGPINKEWKSIEHVKNDIVNNLAGKYSHESFEKYVSSEFKLKILEERNTHAAQRKHNLPQCWKISNYSIQYCFLLVTTLLQTKIF